MSHPRSATIEPMTSDSSVSPSAARLLPELPALLAGLADPLEADAVRVLVHCIRDDRPPTVDELRGLTAAAVRRAEQDAPVASVAGAVHAAAAVVVGRLAEPVSTDVARLLSALEVVTAAVTSAFVDEHQAIRADERDARRALASALISGDPVDDTSAHLGVPVAPAYVAVALQLPPPDDARSARQRLRRLQEQLDAFAGESVLGLLDATGGTALLPATADDVADVLARLPGLLADVAAAVGAEPLAGAAGCVGVIAVARAARQARDVLTIARRLGRPPGVYLLDDVLLEYQLTRDSDARPLLAGLLDPLDRNPDLVETLERYFALDLDRRGTASALHVHPNTLDYRLRRVAQLTGLDPAKPSGQQLLAAALTARRLV